MEITTTDLSVNIGKKCMKKPINEDDLRHYQQKPFKSGFKTNTIKGVIDHPQLPGKLAYTFFEDDSYVEVRRCEIID